MRSSRSPRTNVFVWAPVVAFALLAWHRRWTSDDGFINLRVVDQIVHGNGPVFNAGERVEAFTSPLWIALLTVGRLVLPHAVRLEYIALWLSLALSVFGLAAATAAAVRLATSAPTADRDGRSFWTRRTLFPVGSLLVVGLPPFWDFATSGLESGLVFAWLGGTFWWMVRSVEARADGEGPTRRRHLGLSFVIGLGPLIRPDLTVMSVAFLVGLILCDGRRTLRSVGATIAAAFALPTAYELFRMGYYAALVPNTALTKDANGSEWARGFRYIGDLASRFYVWLPLAVVGAALWYLLARRLRTPDCRAQRIVVVSVVVAAFLHAIYVTRVGGDFMSGRMLLPALFALSMPVAVVSIRWREALAWSLLATVWCGACVATISTGIQPLQVIDDEHAVYTDSTGSQNPVTIADYRNAPWMRMAERLHTHASAYRGELLTDRLTWWYGYVKDSPRVLLLARSLPERNGIVAQQVGAIAYRVGIDVYVVDRLGLADPLASRFTGEPLVKPGHDKLLTLPWIEAMRAAASPADANPKVAAQAAVARRALQCGALHTLLNDVQQPLTVGRFLSNITGSWHNTTLRVPFQPGEAVRDLCR